MLRDILTEKDSKEEEGRMLNKLHGLDDTIEDFISGLEDKINAIEDNPMFIKKAHQLLANMSKEYSEFIMALRGVVNAVDRKGQILPSEPMKPSKPRDVNVDAGEEEEGEEEVEVGSPPNESKIYKALSEVGPFGHKQCKRCGKVGKFEDDYCSDKCKTEKESSKKTSNKMQKIFNRGK